MPSPRSVVPPSVRLSVLAAVIGLLAGCGVPTASRWDRGGGDSTDGPAFSVDTPGVRYFVEEAPVSASTELTARVLPAAEVVVNAPVAGRVAPLTSTGSEVRTGDEVAEIVGVPDELDDLRVDIFELQSELAEREGRADDVAAAQDAIAEIRSRRAADTVTIVSPSNGVLGRFLTSRSVDVQIGDPILTVGDPGALRVDVEIGEDRLDDLAVGTRLRVIDAQNRFADPAPAVVTAVVAEPPADASRDESAERWIASAEIDPGSTLVVGDRVLVDVAISTATASRRVSIDAVLDDERGRFLLVVDADGSWRRVDVQVGLVSSDFAEILTDIDVGTEVVVP